MAVEGVWKVRADWGHAGQFGVQIEYDPAVSDDDGSTHMEVKLRFSDGTWGWYPVSDLEVVS